MDCGQFGLLREINYILLQVRKMAETSAKETAAVPGLSHEAACGISPPPSPGRLKRTGPHDLGQALPLGRRQLRGAIVVRSRCQGGHAALLPGPLPKLDAREVPCQFRGDIRDRHLRLLDPDASFQDKNDELCRFIGRGR